MAQDIGTIHGMLLTITQGRLPMVLEFIIIHGQDGDFLLASVMGGLHLDGIHGQEVGGVLLDSGSVGDMDFIGDSGMDTEADSEQAIEPEEEQDIARDREILDKAMCTETGLLA